MPHIHFILTGGTIDKSYDPVTETPQLNAASIVPEYINAKIRPHFETSFETICLLDSNELTGALRAQIAKAINHAQSKHIILVHGTSTMTETMQYLEKALDKDHGKTIILMGAMVPLKEFAMSDAGFNLGYASAQAQTLKSGIYLCMHGETFTSHDVVKNTDEARFEHRRAAQ